MNTFRILRDKECPLEFEGVLLGEVSTRHHRHRWTELRVYRTRGGSYVAEEFGGTEVEHEQHRTKAWACDIRQDVIDTLGDGPLALELYEVAGFNGVERVE